MPLPAVIDPNRCPKCDVATPIDERFCHKCGADLVADRYALQAEPLMRRARNWILAVGIIYLVSAAAMAAIGAVPAEQAKLLLGVNGALCAIHIGLYLWARKSPFPAAVVALVLFLTVHVANAIADPMTIPQGILIKVGMLIALSGAVRAGYQVVKLRGRPT